MRVLNVFYALILLSSATLLLVSCGDDKGCTDPKSTNYNADATEDDGSCIGCTDPSSANFAPGALSDDGSCSTYARDAFYGEYLGDFRCLVPLLKAKLDNDSLMFSVKEPVSETSVQDVILGLTIDGIPVDLEGRISATGDSLLIDDTLENFTIPDFPFEGLTTVANVKGQGFAVISPDQTNLKGNLSLTITSVDGSFDAMDNCALDGNKI